MFELHQLWNLITEVLPEEININHFIRTFIMMWGNIPLGLEQLTSGIVYQIMLLMLILLVILNLVWTNFGWINQLCLIGKQGSGLMMHRPIGILRSLTQTACDLCKVANCNFSTSSLSVWLLDNSWMRQLADCQLADWTTRGLDISRTGQPATLRA